MSDCVRDEQLCACMSSRVLYSLSSRLPLICKQKSHIFQQKSPVCQQKSPINPQKRLRAGTMGPLLSRPNPFIHSLRKRRRLYCNTLQFNAKHYNVIHDTATRAAISIRLYLACIICIIFMPGSSYWYTHTAYSIVFTHL